MAFGRRRNRPGLIETAARTAVITGTASAVSGRSANKRAAQAAAAAAPAPEAPVAAPAVAAAGGEDVIAKLERLAALHASGALSDAEFAALKAQAIGS